jgi:hypothetical protein
MDFEVPESLSSDGDGSDYLQVTFWGSDLIVGQNGLPIELGLTVTKEISRQVNRDEASQVSGTAELCAKILISFIVITFFACLFMMADFTPYWSMFHTVQIIVHFPMFGMNIPGQLALFFAELVKVSKFNIFGVNESIVEKWGSDPSDTQQNAVFSQMSYQKYSLIPNLGIIYYMFWIFVGLTIFGCLIDTIFRKFRNVDGATNPLTKFGVNFLLRFFMAAYLEVCISCMIQFQNIQLHGFKYVMSSLSAVLFMAMSVGIILFVLFLIW